jgi:hypothetical protein
MQTQTSKLLSLHGTKKWRLDWLSPNVYKFSPKWLKCWIVILMYWEPFYVKGSRNVKKLNWGPKSRTRCEYYSYFSYFILFNYPKKDPLKDVVNVVCVLWGVDFWIFNIYKVYKMPFVLWSQNCFANPNLVVGYWKSNTSKNRLPLLCT